MLNLVGISYGLPHFFVGDEQSQLGASLVMLKNQTIAPVMAPDQFHLLYYPPVMSYLYLLILVPVLIVWSLIQGFDPSELAREVVLNPTIPWLAGRVLIAILGTVSVYLVYLLGKRLWNEKIGLFAAFFLGTSFLYISLSHFTRHWVPTIFFEILVMLAAFNIWKYGNKRDYIWSAVFAALSFGVGFIGILTVFFPVIAHLARYGRSIVSSLRDKKIWIFFVVLVFLVGTIIALYPQRFLEISQGTDISIAEGKSFKGFFDSFGFHFLTVMRADPALFALGAIGILWGLKNHRKLVCMALVYIVFYISCLYFLIHNEPRYVSFLYPIFALLAALPAQLFIERLKGPMFAKITSALLLLLFIGYPIAVAGRFDWLLLQDDTRIAAKKWIEANLPADARIISYLRPEVLTLNKESIQLQKDLDPSSLRARDLALFELPPDAYPKSFHLLSIPKLSSANVDISQSASNFQPNYSVIQFWNLADYLSIPSKYKTDPDAVRFIPAIGGESVDFNGNFDITTFLLFKLERLGPVVEVNKLFTPLEIPK